MTLRWIGIATSLSILIFTIFSALLLFNHVRTQFLLMYFLPTLAFSICFGIYSLRLKERLQIIYLASLLICIALFLRDGIFFVRAGVFAGSWELLDTVNNLLLFVLIPLLTIYCLMFIVALIIFFHVKVKKKSLVPK